MMPSVRPPRTAPIKLSIPPITAATKPNTKRKLNSKDFIVKFCNLCLSQNKYSDLTNVNSLKIKYNRMLGYHIEVRAVHDKALRDKDIFIHRQTTSQTSRFTTIELNEAENQLINSYDKSISIEMDIFKNFTNQIINEGKKILDIASAISELDIGIMVVKQSKDRDYVCPKILENKTNTCTFFHEFHHLYVSIN